MAFWFVEVAIHAHGSSEHLLSVHVHRTLRWVLGYKDGQDRVPVLKAPHQAFGSHLVSSPQGDRGPRAHCSPPNPRWVVGFCKLL